MAERHGAYPLFTMPPLPLSTLLLFLLLQVPPLCSSAASDTLAAGQVLAVGGKLVSGNGKFVLGFFQPAAGTIISKSSDNATTPSPSWYLGIWFNKIPVFTTVWVANREDPITHPNLTHLKISDDGNLVILVNHANNSESVVWSTNIINNRTKNSIINTTSTSAAVLLDTGNLALAVKDSLSSSSVLQWQSFDYPRDVFLPGAKFGRNKVTGLSRRAISKKSIIDPGLGSYSLELEDTRGIILKRRKNPSVEYWVYASSAKVIPTLKFILGLDPRTKDSINPTYVDNKQEEYYMYTSPDESSSTFVSLDISGQIKINVWCQTNQSWQTIYARPADPCTPAATCGPFTVCNGIAQPFCDCMGSFSQKSPRDWEIDDRTGGCIRNTPLHCNTSSNNNDMASSTDMFQPIAQVTLPYNPQRVDFATTQSKCEESCLRSCSCTAYSYNTSRCSVWHGELLSVNLNDGIDNISEDVLYLRLAAKDVFSRSTKDRRKPVVAIVTVTSIIGFGLMLMLLLLTWRNKFKWCGLLPLYAEKEGSAGGIIAFKYNDLVRCTKNFSEKLGGGGFGSVYWGVLSDSKTTVAVKRLDGAHQGEKQFRAEVSSVGLIQHINLVRLIGFYWESDQRLLVYEHMLNGSLDGHLFNKSNVVTLNWNTRYQITLGLARGLSYLHHSWRECIIHCDIKPENILLDASFVPKVADFGLAAFVGRDFSRVLTTLRGTVGYLAPEWLSGVSITPKIDAYSFGMVLLEIISGRRNSSPETPDNTSSSINNNNTYQHLEYFPVQAIIKLHSGDVNSLVDPRLHGEFSLEEAERVCKVACWCIQDDEVDRPTMSEVVRVLEGLQEIDTPPMPRLLAAITEQSGATSSV